jgi:Predicted permeases
MMKMKKVILNNKLFAVVLLTYIVLTVSVPEKAILAFHNSLYYVKEMLMIMPVILLLTSLITAWVPRRTIENNFGKGSGIKGAILSFLFGSFSAGPIYAAFPVCKALLAKGASISNIVVILSTWAVIKFPMLINETKFLSPKFMIFRWILTSISIFLIGYIMSKLVKKEDLPKDSHNNEAEGSRLTINRDYCMGCGLCTKIAPEYFEMIDTKASVKMQITEDSELDGVNEAVTKCPAKVIVLK